jgi:hypothetical protein
MTSLLEAVRWDVVAAGFQLALCVAILAGWIRRRRSRQTTAGALPESPPKAFALEVLLRAIRQQTEQSLQAILTTVATERERLQQTLAMAGVLQPPADAEATDPAEALDGFRWGGAELDESGDHRYGGVNELATQGLNPKQIADRLCLPAGEIELALKMRDVFAEGRPAGEGRQ